MGLGHETLTRAYKGRKRMNTWLVSSKTETLIQNS